MCHGIDAKGKVNVGPSLIGKDYAKAGVTNHIRAIITDGSKTNPEMPPFHARHGGPLNDSEIDSLVRYLTFKSKQSKVSSQ